MYFCSICQCSLTRPITMCGSCYRKYNHCRDEWFTEAARIEDRQRYRNARFYEKETVITDLPPSLRKQIEEELYSRL